MRHSWDIPSPVSLALGSSPEEMGPLEGDTQITVSEL